MIIVSKANMPEGRYAPEVDRASEDALSINLSCLFAFSTFISFTLAGSLASTTASSLARGFTSTFASSLPGSLPGSLGLRHIRGDGGSHAWVPTISTTDGSVTHDATLSHNERVARAGPPASRIDALGLRSFPIVGDLLSSKDRGDDG